MSAFIATAFAQNDALAARMDQAEPDVLAYMSFPAAHRAKLRSTNPLERLEGKTKRRADVVGTFPERGRHHAAGRRHPA